MKSIWLHILFGNVTDRGDVRQENQDSIFLAQESVNGCPAAVFGVADGMGGLSYGAQVSQYIARQVLRWWQEEFLPMVRDGMESEDDIRELLEQSVWDMNQTCTGSGRPWNAGPALTLSLVVLMGKRFYIANVGDSRVYLYREREAFPAHQGPVCGRNARPVRRKSPNGRGCRTS